MENFMEQNDERVQKTPRELLREKLLQYYPDRRVETDDDLFDLLCEYDSQISSCYDRLKDGQLKLAYLFNENPRVGAFISDVVSGDDALLACVRHFGRELLESRDDFDTLDRIRREDMIYRERRMQQRKMEEERERNWERSERIIAAFKTQNGLSDEAFDRFLEEVYDLVESIFMGKFSMRTLGLLYRGINYESDMMQAEMNGEVRGKNQRILLERERAAGDSLPSLHNRTSVGGMDDDDRLPLSGYRRQPSVWDL